MMWKLVGTVIYAYFSNFVLKLNQALATRIVAPSGILNITRTCCQSFIMTHGVIYREYNFVIVEC